MKRASNESFISHKNNSIKSHLAEECKEVSFNIEIQVFQNLITYWIYFIYKTEQIFAMIVYKALALLSN